MEGSGEMSCPTCGKALFGDPKCRHCKIASSTPSSSSVVPSSRGTTAPKKSGGPSSTGEASLASFMGKELGIQHAGRSSGLVKSGPKGGDKEDVTYHSRTNEQRQQVASMAKMVVGTSATPEGKVLKPSELKKARGGGDAAPAVAPIAAPAPTHVAAQQEEGRAPAPKKLDIASRYQPPGLTDGAAPSTAPPRVAKAPAKAKAVTTQPSSAPKAKIAVKKVVPKVTRVEDAVAPPATSHHEPEPAPAPAHQSISAPTLVVPESKREPTPSASVPAITVTTTPTAARSSGAVAARKPPSDDEDDEQSDSSDDGRPTMAFPSGKTKTPRKQSPRKQSPRKAAPKNVATAPKVVQIVQPKVTPAPAPAAAPSNREEDKDPGSYHDSLVSDEENHEGDGEEGEGEGELVIEDGSEVLVLPAGVDSATQDDMLSLNFLGMFLSEERRASTQDLSRLSGLKK